MIVDDETCLKTLVSSDPKPVATISPVTEKGDSIPKSMTSRGSDQDSCDEKQRSAAQSVSTFQSNKTDNDVILTPPREKGKSGSFLRSSDLSSASRASSNIASVLPQTSSEKSLSSTQSGKFRNEEEVSRSREEAGCRDVSSTASQQPSMQRMSGGTHSGSGSYVGQLPHYMPASPHYSPYSMHIPPYHYHAYGQGGYPPYMPGPHYPMSPMPHYGPMPGMMHSPMMMPAYVPNEEGVSARDLTEVRRPLFACTTNGATGRM